MNSTSIPSYRTLLNSKPIRIRLLFLLFANFITISGVIFLDWSIYQVLMTYFYDSFIVGGFNVVKIMFAQGKPSPANPKDLMLDEKTGKFIQPWYAQDKPFRPVQKIGIAIFFLIHYGIFVGVQYIFITNELKLPEGIDQFWWYMPVIGMLVVQMIDLVVNFIGKGDYLQVNAAEQMVHPYARVFVQQFVVIFGAFGLVFVGQGVEVLYMILLIVFRIVFDVLFFVQLNRAKFKSADLRGEN